MKTKSKYGVAAASERMFNGKLYDSKLEMSYRKHLELLKKAANPKDRVVNIEEQLPFQIEIKGVKICKYLVDFAVEYGDGRVEFVDVKGVQTDIYKLKKKLVEAQFAPIKIKEVIKGQF